MSKIILKKSSVSDKKPNISDLEIGEVAVNLSDKKIFSKTASNEVIQVSSGSLFGLDDTSDNVATEGQILQFKNSNWEYESLNPVITINILGAVTGSSSATLKDLTSNTINVTTILSEGYPSLSGNSTTYSNATFTSNVDANDSLISNNVNVLGTITSSSIVGIGQGFSNIEIKLVSGEWNIPSGVKKWKMTLIASGGAGGGCPNEVNKIGNGGASGAAAIHIFTKQDGINTVTYNIGSFGVNGGNNADGGDAHQSNIFYDSTIIIAEGGKGGKTSEVVDGFGIGGTASNAIFNLNGFSGQHGNSGDEYFISNNICGSGANSPLGYGMGGLKLSSSTGGDGSPGEGYGSGGSGGYTGSNPVQRKGGNGAPGLLIIEY